MAQRKFIIDGGFKTDDASELLANLTMGGHILPTVDSDGTTGFDLGSPTAKWKDLYLSQGSLYINNQKVLEDDSGTIVVRADIDQGITVKAEGTGVLTLASSTPLAMAATLQMADGKNITDANGIAVQFGDKINMNGNTIISVGTPVGATDVSNKAYVDQKVADIINGAPAALDTLNELANALGDNASFASEVTNTLATHTASLTANTSAIAVNVSGVATNAAAIIVNNDQIVTEKVLARSNEALLNVAINDETARAAAAEAVLTTAVNTKAAASQVTADIATAKTGAESVAAAYTDTREVAITTAYQAYSDSGTSSGAVTSANNYTDAEVATATTSLQSYADTAEADAIASAESKDVARMVTSDAYADASEAAAISSAAIDASTKANAAQAAAEAAAVSANTALSGTLSSAITTGDANVTTAAATDATTKADAALVSAKAYADTAEADAISTASSDATTKADAALVSAKAYADTAEADAISTASSDATTKADAAQAAAIAAVTGGAGAAFDTLKEIQDAMATDTELGTAITNVTSSAASTAAADATTKANAAQAAAIASAEAKDVVRATQSNAYADTKKSEAVAISYSYSDTAEADAISTASGDATTKADAALAAAKVYADNGDANTTYTAGNGMTLSGTQFLMSGAYTGNFTATGDITAYSDDTLKTNVQVIDGALGRVEAIRGVTFERIEDGSVSTGVIAQELKAVLPEAVHTDANGVHSVAYGNITGLLIEAVKELSAQVAELKKSK